MIFDWRLSTTTIVETNSVPSCAAPETCRISAKVHWSCRDGTCWFNFLIRRFICYLFLFYLRSAPWLWPSPSFCLFISTNSQSKFSSDSDENTNQSCSTDYKLWSNCCNVTWDCLLNILLESNPAAAWVAEGCFTDRAKKCITVAGRDKRAPPAFLKQCVQMY